MRVIFLILIFVNSTLMLIAQQQTHFTQFYNNEIVFNPAVSGSKTYNPLVLQTRQQWLGFEGAPFSSSISYHKLVNQNSAFGGIFNYELTSPAMKVDVEATYAFHVPLNSNKTFLSFGIAPSLMYYSINFDLEDLPENRDPAFSESTYSSGSIDFSSGIYLYNERPSIGLSCVNMIQSSFDGEVLVQSNQTIGKTSFGRNIQERIFFSLLSYNFDIINNDWQFEPILLIRSSSSYSSVYDFVSRIKYLKDNWFGLGYRSDGTTSISFGIKANNLHIGYSYDYQLLSNIMSSTYGTHEITLSFYIPAFQHNRHTNYWIF